MSARETHRRDRKHEAKEQLRAERQRKGQCIDCGVGSRTQRCASCTKRVEEATPRYVGQARRGRMTILATDKRDARFVAEEFGKYCSGLGAIEMLGEMPARKRDDLYKEPLHHAHLAWKFLGEILDRSGLFPMTSRGKGGSKPVRRDPKPPNRQLAFKWAER